MCSGGVLIMRSVKSLLDWCADVCEDYTDVHITDLSSSFTDGLAFCAIIHKHRPDLIDFHSLSKHNVYENIRLAFDVAECKLGIPALLDPEELMCVEEPDLLSIITYISQLFCVFSRNSHDSKKIPVNSEPNRTRTREHRLTQSSGDVIRSAGKSICVVCNKHVHLIQRVLVNNRLYHRTCFRCSRCRRSLLPSSYTEGSTGSLQCSYQCLPASEHHLHTDTLVNIDSKRDKTESDGDGTRGSGLTLLETDIQKPKPEPRQRAGPQKPPRPAPRSKDRLPASSQTVKRKEHPWMKLVEPGPWHKLPPAPAPLAPPHSCAIPALSQVWHRHWATNFNPFLEEGEEDTVDDVRQTQPSVMASSQSWSSVLDESCDPAGGPEITGLTSVTAKPVYPFDQSRRTGTNQQNDSTKAGTAQPETGLYLDSSGAAGVGGLVKTVSGLSVKDRTGSDSPKKDKTSDLSSTESVLNSALEERFEGHIDKKRQLPHQSPDLSANHSLFHSDDITPSHLSANEVEAAPLHQKKETPSSSSSFSHVKSRNQTPFNSKTSDKHKPTNGPVTPRAAAPGHGFPLVKRKVHTDGRVSEEEVCEEQRELEERLMRLEKRGVELERDMRSNTTAGARQESLIVDWFTLVHEKHMLVRRDAELVYMVKQQRLEEQQCDVEFELRRLLNKPEREWSSDDRRREQQLMSNLLSIIQQRNDIISSLEQDRQREEEEDTILTAVIQTRDFHTQTEKQPEKCNRKFKPLRIFKSIGRKKNS
ncbi:MICAL-like protein 1 [Myxocyprinus asiaticus]|uniref:MICAL-like protein 1 n=1 Tax=Myxocyprinus asiaticus TaxID=70543 RepID=UPI002222C81C|nr:MICAL-like protein 1 [Myxocyprinus asiaticus]